MDCYKVVRRIRRLVLTIRAVPKTVFFNFYYFPLAIALRFPVFVSHRVRLMEMRGSVMIQGPMKTGMIKIGFGDIGVFDSARSRAVWQVSGSIAFGGRATLGQGTKISVKGELSLGERFEIMAESTIICNQKITFGRDCLVSWECLFMDTDYHRIVDMQGVVLNPDDEIRIGDHVWMGCRCLVLKGTVVGDNAIVGASTLLNSKVQGAGHVIAGNPARVVKEDIRWEW